MRILVTATAYPPSVGGAQLLAHQLARRHASRHELQVVTQWDTTRADWLLGTTLNAPRPARSYEVDGLPVRRLTLPTRARYRLAPWVLTYYALQGPALRRIAAALAEQISPWADGADIVHNYRIGRAGISYASLMVARDKGVPFVLTPMHHPRWNSWFHRHYHHLYREADALIALTEVERETLIGMGVDSRRVSVAGVGPTLADCPDPLRFRAQHGLGDDPLVLFLGQKYAYKGLGATLRAARRVWRRIPRAQFAFIGPRTNYSRRLFRETQDPRVIEMGTVSLQEKTDALAACDLLCVPSSQESFGAVYVEAWMLGKPVIGGSAAALEDVIDDGVNGFRVLARAGEIADRVIILLTNAAQRERMGQAGRAKALGFTWPSLAARVEALYKALRDGRDPADV